MTFCKIHFPELCHYLVKVQISYEDVYYLKLIFTKLLNIDFQKHYNNAAGAHYFYTEIFFQFPGKIFVKLLSEDEIVV